jgi:superfamily II DNA or RNA helicase
LKITISDRTCQVEADSDILKRLSLLLSYEIKDKFFSPQYRSGRWDGRIRLFSMKSKTFNIGLLYRVITWLQLEKIEYQVFDQRNLKSSLRTEYIQKNRILYDDIKLRSYQIEAIESFLKPRFGLPNTRGIFSLPPRSGKTLVSGVLGLVLNEYPLMFIVHRIDLAYQARRVFEKLYKKKIGIVGDGIFDVDSDIVISTIQSICSAYDIKDKFDEKEKSIKDKEQFKEVIESTKTVIVDECHVSGSEVWQQLPKILKSIKYGVGLSGTPYRDDGADMLVEQLWGNIVYELTRDKAVEYNSILPIKCYFVILPEIPVTKGDYQTQKSEAVNNNKYLLTASKKLKRRLEKKNMSSVIVIKEKSQGKNLHDILECEYLHGGIKGSKRDEVYQKMRDKEIMTTISTVTDIGVDIPSLDAVIIASPSKSKVAFYQRIRCGTPMDGKTYGYMFILCPNIKGVKKDYLRTHWKKMMGYAKKENSFQIKEIQYEQL